MQTPLNVLPTFLLTCVLALFLQNDTGCSASAELCIQGRVRAMGKSKKKKKIHSQRPQQEAQRSGSLPKLKALTLRTWREKYSVLEQLQETGENWQGGGHSISLHLCVDLWVPQPLTPTVGSVAGPVSLGMEIPPFYSPSSYHPHTRSHIGRSVIRNVGLRDREGVELHGQPLMTKQIRAGWSAAWAWESIVFSVEYKQLE